ncbi:hypothetical protein LPC27_15715 [Paraclostridium bifermentans]|nr:hypothetical protein [Paraclostridium bifermentans]EQK46903.1 hypothetical protein C671_1196 [[Clostridium] bifermentans ATCC 19299] [Paraclostridium bifermentans ATCC 19299]MCE9677226.1 hypothetical protein [Paraclostridium bifermentans]
MKKWKDADEVIKMIHELPNEKLRNIDKEMSKKPNFEHNADVGKKVKRK